MPPNNLGFALAAADLIMQGAKARSMAAYNRSAILGDAVRRIPGNVGSLVQARDARQAQEKRDQVFDLQLQDAKLTQQRTMKDMADEQAIRDLFGLVPRTPQGEMDYGRIAEEAMTIDPVRAAQIQQVGEQARVRGRQRAQERAETVARELFDVQDQDGWERAMSRLSKKGIDTKGLPTIFDRSWRDTAVAEAMTFAQWVAGKAPEEFTLNPGDVRFRGDTKIAENVKPTEPVQIKATEIRLVDGRRRDVILGDDGNWYLPGNMQTPIAGDRVRPLPEKVDGEAQITQAQRQSAETRKATRLFQLEQQYQASQRGGDAGLTVTNPDGTTFSLGGSGKRPMTAEELYKSKLFIENAYRQELGLARLTELPREWGNGGRPATTTPPPPANTAPVNGSRSATPTNATPQAGERRMIGDVLGEWAQDPQTGQWAWYAVENAPAASSAPRTAQPPATTPAPAAPQMDAPTTATPKIGERRPINGVLNEWDGYGWYPVENNTNTPPPAGQPARAATPAAPPPRPRLEPNYLEAPRPSGAQPPTGGPAGGVTRLPTGIGTPPAEVRPERVAQTMKDFGRRTSGAVRARTYEGTRSPSATRRAINNIAADARIHGGREKFAAYVEANRAAFDRRGIDVPAYLAAIRRTGR